MKKSSTYVTLLSCFRKWLLPAFFVTILVSFISEKTQAQTLDPFSRQNQFDFKILNPQTAGLNQQNSPVQWETIQTIILPQRDPNSPLPPTKFNLDQVRNGSADKRVNPADWVNGNAGSSNAHYVEGYSIPYRVDITDLPVGTHSLDIEWDIRQSGANAIDFVTNYDLINFPAGSHVFNFGHTAETINPLTEAGPWADGSSSIIPNPNLPAGAVTTYYNSVMAYSNASGPANKFSVWNANITNMFYVSEGSLAAQSSSTRLRIIFANIAEHVVISWGGHIAKGEGVWGNGNSASAVEGSPYHTRLISWDLDGDGNNQTSIGNQDRSLSAAAVLDPPICELDGPSTLQCTATSSFTSGVAASDLSQGVSFDWDIIDATNCGTVTLLNETVGSVSVTTSSACGCTFSVVYKIIKSGEEVSRCVKNITVTDTQAPGFTSSPTGSDLGCNPTGLPAPVNPSATDNCGTPTVTSSEGSISTTGCNRTQTRTYTARDACGNTATISQTFTWKSDLTGPVFTACPAGSNLGCNPIAIPEPGVATATDNCGGSPTITSALGDEVGTGCSKTRTRTYTARDACGNTSTCQQVFTYVLDATPPVFTSCPSTVTVECGSPTSTAALGAAIATDACGSVTTTSSDGTTAVGCQTVITRTWTARDGCGNTATCVQRILVIDRTAPVITCNPDGSATATDCGSYFLYKNGTIWTAIDGSGNIRTANCTVQGARIMSSPVTIEQKEQTPTLTEEKTNAKAIVKASIVANDVKVSAVPNPFNDKVKFVVTSQQPGYGTLEVMNVLGQKVKTVYQGRINAGEQYFEMSLPAGRYSSLLYILRINGKQVTGKLIQKN